MPQRRALRAAGQHEVSVRLELGGRMRRRKAAAARHNSQRGVSAGRTTSRSPRSFGGGDAYCSTLPLRATAASPTSRSPRSSGDAARYSAGTKLGGPIRQREAVVRHRGQHDVSVSRKLG